MISYQKPYKWDEDVYVTDSAVAAIDSAATVAIDSAYVEEVKTFLIIKKRLNIWKMKLVI